MTTSFLWLLSLVALFTSARSLTLTGDEVWVVSPTEPSGVALALADVMLDYYLVLGRRPVVLPAPPSPKDIPSNTTLIFVGSTEAAPWLGTSPRVIARCLTGWESHCVLVGGMIVAGYPSTIVATGSGMRGAIFGAYALSEGVLGVNPLKHFTDDVPAYAAPLAVADDLAIVFAPPRFKYRGLFVNDEDLLANLFPDPLGLAAIDLRAYNRVIETLLRLKGNLLIPATNPFPDQQVNALIGRRGAVLSFHHYDLVGANVFSWPLPSTDWTWTKNAGTMSALYQAAINAQAGGGEVLWSVGLRGLNDIPYPCSSPAACGADVTAAMANQTAWIRAAPGRQANASIIFYTWQEDLELLVGGHLHLPPGVDLLFTDAGNGYIRVNSNWSTYCAGVYYHSAMLDGSANQLGEMVPIDRTISQFLPVIQQSKSTTVVIDNVSDLRPVPLTTAALMALVWDPEPFFNASSPAVAAADFTARFAAQQLHLPGGAANPTAAAFAGLWARFFALPYIYAGLSDNFYANELRNQAYKGSQGVSASGKVDPGVVSDARKAVAALSNGSDASGASVVAALDQLLADARALAPSIPPSRVGWYTSHTLTQFGLHAACGHALVALRDALVAGAEGDWAGARTAGATALDSANGVLGALRTGEAASAPDTWRGLYAGDFLVDLQVARDSILRLVAALEAPGAALPLPPVDNSELWYKWDRVWQGAPAVAAAYPLSQRFDPDVAFSRMVRTNCVFSDVDAGRCETSPTGGVWKRGSGAGVTLQILTSQTVDVGSGGGGDPSPLTIRYTTDGTAPTPTSPSYTTAIKLDSIGGDLVTVSAAPFDKATGAMAGPLKVTTWHAQ